MGLSAELTKRLLKQLRSGYDEIGSEHHREHQLKREQRRAQERTISSIVDVDIKRIDLGIDDKLDKLISGVERMVDATQAIKCTCDGCNTPLRY